MKRFIIFCLFSFSLCTAFGLSFSDNYTHTSHFWRNSASAYMAAVQPFFAGAEFDITEHDDFAHHIYEFRVPMGIKTDTFFVKLTPFVIPDNGNNSSAYGGKIMFSTGLKVNEIDFTATEGYVSAAVVSQKAFVVKNNIANEKDTFIQSAYEAGITSNYFGAYSFTLSGNVFQFLSGLEAVQYMGSVFNQAELADLGTIDYLLKLPRGSAGLKINWHSQESSTDSFISYRYINIHQSNDRHSLLFNTSIFINERASLNLAYNHIFISKETDIDLYSAGLSVKL